MKKTNIFENKTKEQLERRKISIISYLQALIDDGEKNNCEYHASIEYYKNQLKLIENELGEFKDEKTNI